MKRHDWLLILIATGQEGVWVGTRCRGSAAQLLLQRLWRQMMSSVQDGRTCNLDILASLPQSTLWANTESVSVKVNIFLNDQPLRNNLFADVFLTPTLHISAGRQSAVIRHPAEVCSIFSWECVDSEPAGVSGSVGLPPPQLRNILEAKNCWQRDCMERS